MPLLICNGKNIIIEYNKTNVNILMFYVHEGKSSCIYSRLDTFDRKIYF